MNPGRLLTLAGRCPGRAYTRLRPLPSLTVTETRPAAITT